MNSVFSILNHRLTGFWVRTLIFCCCFQEQIYSQLPTTCTIEEIQKIKAGDPQSGGTFSSPITVSGNRMAAASFYCDGNRGAIYTFVQDPANIDN